MKKLKLWFPQYGNIHEWELMFLCAAGLIIDGAEIIAFGVSDWIARDILTSAIELVCVIVLIIRLLRAKKEEKSISLAKKDRILYVCSCAFSLVCVVVVLCAMPSKIRNHRAIDKAVYLSNMISDSAEIDEYELSWRQERGSIHIVERVEVRKENGAEFLSDEKEREFLRRLDEATGCMSGKSWRGYLREKADYPGVMFAIYTEEGTVVEISVWDTFLEVDGISYEIGYKNAQWACDALADFYAA